jgi:hypothetical protein
MDPYYKALSLFRLRKYEPCIELCNQLLANSPQLQGPWELKMRAMTQRVYVDDIEAEDDGVVGSYKNIFPLPYHHSFDRNSMLQKQCTPQQQLQPAMPFHSTLRIPFRVTFIKYVIIILSPHISLHVCIFCASFLPSCIILFPITLPWPLSSS